MGAHAGSNQLSVVQTDLRETVAGVGGRLLYWEFAERVRASMKWNMASLAELVGKYHHKALIVCGGGPSIKNDLDTIRELQRQGGYVLCCNKTEEYFRTLDEPIIPWATVLLDPMEWVADYVPHPRPAGIYFVASSCHPRVARRIKLAGGKVYLWHAGADFYGINMPHPILEKDFADKAWAIIVGPTTVGLRSIPLGYQLGFRPFHLFGMDSSMASNDDGTHSLHAYAKPRPEDSVEGNVTLNTKAGKWTYYTNSHMSRQAIDFEDLIANIGEHVKNRVWEPVDIKVYGEGLLPAFAASIGLHGNPLMNQKFSSHHATERQNEAREIASSFKELDINITPPQQASA